MEMLPVRTITRHRETYSAGQGRPRTDVIMSRRKFIREHMERLSISQIAGELGVREKCVRNHVRTIRKQEQRKRKCK